MPAETGLPEYVSRYKNGILRYYRRPPKGVTGSAFVRAFGTTDRKVMLTKYGPVHAEAERHFDRLITGRALTDKELFDLLRPADMLKELDKLNGVLHETDHFIGVALACGSEQVKELSLPDLERLALIVQSFYAGTEKLNLEIARNRLENQQEQFVEQFGAESAAPADAVLLDAVFDRWKRERQPTTNTIAEYQRAKDAFVKVNGNLPITDFTTAHVRAWKDHVIAMPGLAHGTRVKWFGSVRTLFKLADGNDLLTKGPNPFDKIKLERPKNARKAVREEWSKDDLGKLFGSPVYTDGKRPRGGAGEAAYWLPILGLYHGARLGELCQLDLADVVTEHGILCLKIRPSDEDEDGNAKSVKTSESIRTVPVHKAVLALGFLDYVESLRRIKAKKLFPAISPDSLGRWSAKWSKWFGRYRRDLGLTDRWRDFHGLRHGWKSAARSARIPKEIHAELSGHESGETGDDYGHVPIPDLKVEIDKI